MEDEIRKAVEAERARWVELCKYFAEDAEPTRKPYETYVDGWIDACNELMWEGEKGLPVDKS